MNDPHLLPSQIDLLVDGDAGFTARPMRAHLADCTECRGRYALARRAADAVEALPHFTPRLPFADHVMARVQVVEPWYVALGDAVLRLIPTRGPMRVLTTIGASLSALAISGGTLWLAFRWEASSWVLGTDVSAALAKGEVWPLALTTGVLALSLLGAALGFRRLAATARANRS